MRLFCVLIATILGLYMIIRSAIRFWKRGRAGVNINEDPGLCEGVFVDFLLLALGVFLIVPLYILLLT